MPVIDIKQVSKIYGSRNANEVNALNTILMVTHDAFSASYCRRILFIQDGQLVKELYRSSSREIFYKQILVCSAITVRRLLQRVQQKGQMIHTVRRDNEEVMTCLLYLSLIII